MNAKEIIINAAGRAERKITDTLANGENLESFLMDSLNLVYLFFNAKYNWPWREKFCTVQTIQNYETGTVTVTNGSRTVSGAGGASFTSSMIGRYLKLTRDLELYEIINVVGGELILREPYIGATGSGNTYVIWKKYYDLPPDVPNGSYLSVWKGYTRANPVEYRSFDRMFSQNAYLKGEPMAWSWYGLNRRVSSYNTGTISATKDSRIFTGAGTAFLGNIFEGTEIIIGGDVYNVESIDSDTQFTSVQRFNTESVTGAAYVAETKNRSQIMLSSVPDPSVVLNISYSKKTYRMKNQLDEPEIYEDYHLALANLLYVYLSEKVTSDKTFSWLTVAEAQVKEVYRNVIENTPLDVAPLVSNQTISGYRKSLYS